MKGVTAPRGFYASGISIGIKEKGPDLALISSPFLCKAAGVFTVNSVKAAPVLMSREHLKDGYAQAIIINSGCANACTGREGELHAGIMCRKTAEYLGIAVKDVLVASTGVIGKKLPIKKIEKSVPYLIKSLTASGGHVASRAILTTDTCPKTAEVTAKISGKKITLGGMAKGAGMIAPNMATLLVFVTTDCNISPILLKNALKEKAEETFNQIVVDGDMSTNDSLFILANGMAANPLISKKGKDYFLFSDALGKLLGSLACKIVSDGEGATKVIEVKVVNAKSLKEARTVSRAIVRSNLVKSMVYGNDPNWGRILASAGSSGNINTEKTRIWIQGINVFCKGSEKKFNNGVLSAKMKSKKTVILIDIDAGKSSASAFGCDLTPEYVHINADYKT